MRHKDGEFVYVYEADGSEWVEYEHFRQVSSIATESKLIINHIQNLLGVYSTTRALARIAELQAIEALYLAAKESGHM